MDVRRFRLALAAALAWATIGCTGDSEPTAERPQPSSPTATMSTPTFGRQDAQLRVSIEQMHGGITREQRPAVKRNISKPIAAWVSAGFSAGNSVGGTYPQAFAGWTRDAAKLARRDDRITTGAGVSEDLSGVVVAASRARLYVFASEGRTGGATARVNVRLTGERQDGSATSYAVTGSLFLTRDESRWRIFGYDLTSKELR